MSGARTLRQVLNDPLGEPVDEFLVILSGISDDEAGSGGFVSGRLTQPESDIRHADRTSREIHAVQDAQSHNLNATLSTPASDGGSA
jgi:hypothetical protein